MHTAYHKVCVHYTLQLQQYANELAWSFKGLQ